MLASSMYAEPRRRERDTTAARFRPAKYDTRTYCCALTQPLLSPLLSALPLVTHCIRTRLLFGPTCDRAPVCVSTDWMNECLPYVTAALFLCVVGMFCFCRRWGGGSRKKNFTDTRPTTYPFARPRGVLKPSKILICKKYIFFFFRNFVYNTKIPNPLVCFSF